jgi:hypothetical protein
VLRTDVLGQGLEVNETRALLAALGLRQGRVLRPAGLPVLVLEGTT